MNDTALTALPTVADLNKQEFERIAEGFERDIALTAETAARNRTDIEALTQRHLDEAMADVVEVVRRQRTRLGRRVCSVPDGKLIREIFALLRNMAGPEISADNDPSWGERGG